MIKENQKLINKKNVQTLAEIDRRKLKNFASRSERYNKGSIWRIIAYMHWKKKHPSLEVLEGKNQKLKKLKIQTEVRWLRLNFYWLLRQGQKQDKN